jgi:hypothetical protein
MSAAKLKSAVCASNVMPWTEPDTCAVPTSDTGGALASAGELALESQPTTKPIALRSIFIGTPAPS